MSTPTHNDALTSAVSGLRDHGVVPAIARPLRANAATVASDLQKHILSEIEAFSSSANPDLRPELEEHLRLLVAEVCRLLEDGRPGNFDFVREYAQRRAEQRFPLEASLHAYRSCHRVIASWVRDAALAVAETTAQVRRVVAAAADFAFEYTDAISTVATSEYVQHTRLLAEAEGDQRTELLNVLLSGYASHSALQSLAQSTRAKWKIHPAHSAWWKQSVKFCAMCRYARSSACATASLQS